MKQKRYCGVTIRPVYIGFLMTFLIAAVIMNLVYMMYYSYSAKKMDETDRYRMLNQTVFYTSRYIKEVEDGANMLAISSSVQKLMTYRIHKNYLDYANCMELLAEYAMTIPGVYRIDLYLQNNHTLLTSYEGVYYDLSEKDRVAYESLVETEANWHLDIHYPGKEPNLVSQTRNEQYVTLVKPVYSKYSGKKTGVLCMSIMVSELKAMTAVGDTTQEDIVLRYAGEPLWEGPELRQNSKVISQKSEYSEIEYDYSYTSPKWIKSNMKVVLTIVAITAFFGMIFFSIVEISERNMFDPVNVLLKGFKEVEQGKFDTRLNDNRKDLFREIFSKFNHMVITLEQMIEELSAERTRRNEFKFRLLQMQIKPHFLYNLFNNMIWMVEQKDYERLEVLIQSTAGYYKTALNYGNQDIMLVENKKQLEYYVEIQKIRFGDGFTFDFELSDEIQYDAIPNLLLQPLVENSIVHGIKGMEQGTGHIKVSAGAEQECLVIIVEDNGCGIDGEILEDIRKEMRNYEGDGSQYFALVNIAARLYNRYKQGTDIKIESTRNEGTKVTIYIPLNEVK